MRTAKLHTLYYEKYLWKIKTRNVGKNFLVKKSRRHKNDKGLFFLFNGSRSRLFLNLALFHFHFLRFFLTSTTHKISKSVCLNYSLNRFENQSRVASSIRSIFVSIIKKVVRGHRASLALNYFSTMIAAGGLNCWVRDGIRWNPAAKDTPKFLGRNEFPMKWLKD